MQSTPPQRIHRTHADGRDDSLNQEQHGRIRDSVIEVREHATEARRVAIEVDKRVSVLEALVNVSTGKTSGRTSLLAVIAVVISIIAGVLALAEKFIK